jgi:hypothetical protein
VRPQLERIQRAFEGARWTTIALDDSKRLQAAFAISYALAGILIADGVEQVLVAWEGAQEALRELKNSSPIFSDNDAYLVIVVPRIDVPTDRLNEVLDNTYVCRKVCVEIDGKTTEEALSELPFFAVSSSNGNLTNKADIEPSKSALSELLLQDLRKASPETLLQSLLDGKYSREGE